MAEQCRAGAVWDPVLNRCVTQRTTTQKDATKELQTTAAKARVGTGTEKATDVLLLEPDKFNKSGAAILRGEEATRTGNPSLRSTESDSRGQQLYADNFEKTYGVTEKNAALAEVQDVAKAADVFAGRRPRSQENEDPRDYMNRVLTFERDEARSAYQKTLEATKGARDSAESQGNTLDVLFQKQKAEALRGRTKVNPAFTNLSTEEKRFNEQHFKKTGKYLVDPTISADTGRAPMRDKPLTEAERRGQASFNQKKADLESAIRAGQTENLPKFSSEELPFLEEYLDFQKFQVGKDQDASIGADSVSELGDSVKELRIELGMNQDQELVFDENGNPQIKDGDEIIDPVERAKKEAEQEKNDDLADMKEAFDLDVAKLENAGRVNGKITEQGRRQIKKRVDQYLDDKAKREKQQDDYIESKIRSEQANQMNIEKRMKERLSPANLRKKAEQNAILSEANAMLKSGAVTNLAAGISIAKSSREQNAKEPTKAQQYKKVDAQIFQPGFERAKAFDTAASVFGYDVKGTADYLKSRGFTDKDIAEQRKSYQVETLGYSEEQIDAEGKELRVSDLYEKEPSEMTAEELDFLQEYEIDNPKKAMRWKLKIQNPEMSDAEIWKQTESAFKTSKAKGTAKVPTISGQKNKFFNDQYEEYITNGKSAAEALRMAQTATDATFGKIKEGDEELVIESEKTTTTTPEGDEEEVVETTATVDDQGMSIAPSKRNPAAKELNYGVENPFSKVAPSKSTPADDEEDEFLKLFNAAKSS